MAAEFVGTAFLLAAVVGSGIMGERLAQGNTAVALLANTIATGAALYVLILTLGPVSGAHFNPAVTLVMSRSLGPVRTASYAAMQIFGAFAGVTAAHLMFGLPIFSLSTHVRSGAAQTFSEFVAAFGLVVIIIAAAKFRPAEVPLAVALYITSAYWFTASTSFANPAVALARSFTNTFSGIRWQDVPAFAAAEFVGAGCASLFMRWLLREERI
jgi:glycerol uptake facilitator-like aquaporin